MVVEPVRTAYPKLACDWTDREAQTFIHWRDFDLHAAHEDREGGFCESNRLWFTDMLTGGADAPGEGVAVLKGGVGMYVGRVCRPRTEGEPHAARCDESKARGTCACVPRAWTVSASGALVTCLSDDPSACR